METIIEELKNRIATLETKMTRQEKSMRKMKRDMIPEDQRVPRKPSGFAKATYMSPTLCEFLDVPEGTEMARTEVTKKVSVREGGESTKPRVEACDSNEPQAGKAPLSRQGRSGDLFQHSASDEGALHKTRGCRAGNARGRSGGSSTEEGV